MLKHFSLFMTLDLCRNLQTGIGVIHRNHMTIEPFHLETYGIHIMNRIFQPETFLEICEQLHCCKHDLSN